MEVGDIVLCVVDRIAGTVVFVKIEGENKEGSIILSEIAPGRIRNLREYVIPKKRIVCKVLRISNDKIDLSLRRVTIKEQKQAKEQAKQEKSYENIIKSIFKDKTQEILNQITKQETLYEFLEKAKQNSEDLEKIAGKENSKKILSIISIQKSKKAIIKKEVGLYTTNSKGLEQIKNILMQIKDCEIIYISAGRYLIKTEAEDIKKADNKLKEILKNLEEKAKKQEIEFSVKEK